MNFDPETCKVVVHAISHGEKGTVLQIDQEEPIGGAKKINANFFCTKFVENPAGHGRPRRKPCMSAPKSAFFLRPR